MKVLFVAVVFVIGIFVWIGITGEEVSECPKFDSSQIQLDSNQFIGEKLFLNGSDTLLMNCDLSVKSESKKVRSPINSKDCRNGYLFKYKSKEFYSIFLHYYADEKGYFFWLSVGGNDTLIKINDKVNSQSFDYEIKNKDEIGIKTIKIRKGQLKEIVDSKGRLFTAIN